MKNLKQYSKSIEHSLIETGISKKELAKDLDIKPETLSRKLREPDKFTLGEMFIIQTVFRWQTLEG